MDQIEVQGSGALAGEVEVAGSKNASLPLLFAALLTRQPCRLSNVPALADVRTACRLLEGLGVECRWGEAPGIVVLDPSGAAGCEAPYDLVKTMRASFLVLGPLLARFKRARVSMPGGCAIGSRPVNLHLDGLERMGALIQQRDGYVEAVAPILHGANICLDAPAVGATEQLMMAAALAAGSTVIENAACEPEIVDLAAALTGMGARISGAGSSTIRVEGVNELGGFDHRVIPDRIEAGTFLVAAAITGGQVHALGARRDHLESFIAKLGEAGVDVRETSSGIVAERTGALRPVDVRTQPYPGFPTDLQAQTMALMTQCPGRAVMTEDIFENRFMHVQELVRMGADIRVQGNAAIVRGATPLSGAPVMATDLRASVSLVLAGLAAKGLTRISRVYHLDRGYERLEEKLSRIGANIRRVSATGTEVGLEASPG